MGECTCSKIAIMQLFHELKQQFPNLSDNVVAECIAQEGHDRETCARSLQATQERRPSPGAFPPPGPNQEQVRGGSMNQEQVAIFSPATNSTLHRPATLDVGLSRRISCSRVPPINHFLTNSPQGVNGGTFCTQDAYEDSAGSEAAGFEVKVNVACSPVKNTGFGSPPVPPRRSDILYEPRPHYTVVNPPIQSDQSRSFTSVSLTLRPPSSEPQPPIDIRSQRSSLTYSTSSSDSRGFQSRVQISIGPGNVGSVAAARIRPPMAPTRPSSLIPSGQFNSLRRHAGLPPGPPSQLSRPTMTMSAPNTPSGPVINSLTTTTSLPTTPVAPLAIRSTIPPEIEESGLVPSKLNLVTEHQSQLIAEQLERKDRLAREVAAEKGRLEAMKKEIEILLKPFDPSMSPEDYKQKLQREIFQLQSECNKMANEIDQRSGPGIPLGETNEEFYRGIYTGQPFVPRPSILPPPLPTEPPVWQIPANRANFEERDGPSWVCRMCTFRNHTLMKRCELCDLIRIMPPLSSGRKFPMPQNPQQSSSSTPSPQSRPTSESRNTSRK